MQYKDENGVNEPSRRRLLKGIGALALAGSCPVAHAQKTQSAPGTLSPDARNEKQPFYGEHQAGILTPQQAAMMLVAFDVLASDKADLERLFRLLTQRFAFLTQGGAAPETPNPRLPPLDSGILGGYIAPDNLTITLSVGHSLFDERFGLAPQMPKKLQKMTRFPNDSLDAALCHGDVLLQICANTQTRLSMRCAISSNTRRICSVCAGSGKGLFPITRRVVKAKRRRLICWVSKTALPIPIARMIS